MNTSLTTYDKTDPISIFEYAKPLIGHTLRDLVGDETINEFISNSKSQNKGELGQMIEDVICSYVIHLYATNDQHKLLETLILCTNNMFPNPSSHRIDSFGGHIKANELSGEFLRDNVYTLVHYRGRFLNFQAFSPS